MRKNIFAHMSSVYNKISILQHKHEHVCLMKLQKTWVSAGYF